MSKSSYFQKLKDPRWQKKRLEVMQANDFCCELCGDSNSTLHVHHKEYFKANEPWEYDVKQLAVLCDECHENHHLEDIQLLKYVCSYLPLDGPANRDEAAMLLAGFLCLDYEGFLHFSDLKDNSTNRRLYIAGRNAHFNFEGKNNGQD